MAKRTTDKKIFCSKCGKPSDRGMIQKCRGCTQEDKIAKEFEEKVLLKGKGESSSGVAGKDY